MSSPLRLNSSVIAGLMGRHAYVSQSDALLTSWKSSDRESYISAHHRLGTETPEERKQRIRDIYPDLDSFARTTKPSHLSMSSLLSRDDLWGVSRFVDDMPSGRSMVTKRDAVRVAIETANTTHGIDRERKILGHVNDILGNSFKECDTLYSRCIGRTLSGREVYLQGRVDAVSNQTPPALLEIKTRARGLKMAVPEYERIQVEAYIYLTRASQAFHVEAYYPSKRPDSLPDMNVSVIDRDEERLESMISRALRSARVVEHLIDDLAFQERFIRSTSRDALVKDWLDESI